VHEGCLLRGESVCMSVRERALEPQVCSKFLVPRKHQATEKPARQAASHCLAHVPPSITPSAFPTPFPKQVDSVV